jgi:glycosyltransferase involved in cell wall biosynthesis
MTSFSVIIPTRGRPRFLREALQSVADQSRPPREIIVVDDGEGAAAVAKDISPTIRILDNHRRGPVAARNLGVASATSDCIVFLDDDDWLTSQSYFAEIAQQFADGADFCFGDGVLFHSDGRAPLPFCFPADVTSLERDNTILISAVSYRRRLHERLGPFDAALPFYWDWDWYLRVARSGARMHHHEKPVAAIRVHPQNMSGADTEAGRRANLEAFARKYGLPPLILKNHQEIARSGLAPA